MERATVSWALGLALVWYVLAPGLGGVPAGIVAVGTGLALRGVTGVHPGAGIRPFGLVSFVPYFLYQSILGGWDVARRALAPRLPVHPVILHYRVALPSGAPRVFLGNAVSLLPGTFAAELVEDRLTVHLLAPGADPEGQLRDLERRVARVFGVDLG